jgi:hypothetical protein
MSAQLREQHRLLRRTKRNDPGKARVVTLHNAFALDARVDRLTGSNLRIQSSLPQRVWYDLDLDEMPLRL